MIISILKEADKETKLWSAEKGRDLRNKILDRISIVPALDILILDLNKIEVMDSSYAREGFVKTIMEMRMDSPHPQILLKNVNEYVRQNLDLSFNFHKQCTLIVNPEDKWSLIGKCTEQNIETTQVLIKRKEASAKQISKDLGDIGLSATINRLNQLYDFCICTRKDVIQPTGGKEYLFKIDI